MTEQHEFVTKQDLDAQNPINMLKSTWFLLIAGVSAVWFLAGIVSDVGQNTENISGLETSISEMDKKIDELPDDIIKGLQSTFKDIDDKNDAQDERFGAYLDSIRSLRVDMDDEFDAYGARLTEAERKILLLEN